MWHNVTYLGTFLLRSLCDDFLVNLWSHPAVRIGPHFRATKCPVGLFRIRILNHSRDRIAQEDS